MNNLILLIWNFNGFYQQLADLQPQHWNKPKLVTSIDNLGKYVSPDWNTY